MANAEKQTNEVIPLPSSRDYHDVISKVAAVKDLDVDKLQRLLKLQEEWERRQAETHFNQQMAAAQGEMSAVSRDSANPATRSRYASLTALDSAIRPIYTKYGISVDFNEEPYKDDVAHVIASVRCGSVTRHHHLFMPHSTQGARGGSVSTSTHAKMGAITYARRGLLKMIFNLSEEDDDGNTGGNKFERKEQYYPPQKVVLTKPDLSVDEMLKQMEACADLAALNDFVAQFRQWDIFPADREQLTNRYRELRDKFQLGS